MNFPFADILKLLPMVGPTIAATMEFGHRFEELISDKPEDEQASLREALEDIRADNDEAHARLQAKLERAAGR